MRVRLGGSRSVAIVVVFAFLLVHGSYAWCQSDDVHIPIRNESNVEGPDDPSLLTHSTFKAAVDVVLVPVAVTDAWNRPVLGLNSRDFELLEDGKYQKIQYFSAEQAPMSIALLFDVSKSMSNKVEAEREAIGEFVQNANPDDEYFAIAFSDRPRLLAESTQSIDEVERRLISAERGGATAMLDAIYLAESKLRSARYKRRAIVIISDGGDNASRYTLREIKKLIRESDAQIYAIGLFDSFFRTVEEKLGKEWLSEITDASGGRTITINNQSKLPQAAAEISWAMRNEYVLGYRGTNLSRGGWRSIKVRLAASKQRLTAHYRRGYFARTDSVAPR